MYTRTLEQLQRRPFLRVCFTALLLIKLVTYLLTCLLACLLAYLLTYFKEVSELDFQETKRIIFVFLVYT